MLEEFRRDIFVDMVLFCELQRDPHQIQTVHRHPTGSVGLVDVSTRRQRSTPIEHPDIIKAEEPTLENVSPGGVLAIDPPGEIQHQLVKDALQECEIARIIWMPVTPVLAIDLKDSRGCPRVNWEKKGYPGRKAHTRQAPDVARGQCQ